MKQSRQKTQTSQKLNYPKCSKRKQHNKQSLSYICLTATCKQKGLHCTLCKSEHSGHTILPFRSYLSKIEQSLKKMENNPSRIEEKEERIPPTIDLKTKLEDVYIEVMSTMKIQLDIISEKIKLCEEQIIREYENIQNKVSIELEKPLLIQKMIEQINSYFVEEKMGQGNQLKIDAIKLMSLVKMQKNQVCILNEAENISKNFILAGNTFKNNMLIWQRQSSSILTDIFNIKNDYEAIEKGRPVTANPGSKAASTLKFSSHFKTDSITLTNDKEAKLKDEKNGKVILTTQKIIDLKTPIIKFKIGSLAASATMQIGVCLKNLLQQKSYKFQKTSLDHGNYFVSSNMFTYSHNQAATNNVKSDFGFKAGEVVKIEIDLKNKKVIFKKKSDLKTFQMSLTHLSDSQWKELYFGGCINGIWDKLQITA